MKSLNDNETLLLKKLDEKLKEIEKENEHLSPTLNDIYKFIKQFTKIKENEENSQIIISYLKALMNKELTREEFLTYIAKEFILPNLNK